MSSKRKKGKTSAASQSAAAGAPATASYDPATLLSLYSMQQYAALGTSGYGIPSVTTAASTATTDTLGAAATQAASLGANQAGLYYQLAVQDYLQRAQAAATAAAAPPQTSAAPQMPNYEQLLAAAAAAAAQPAAQSSPSAADSLRLPSDTEIIKYTSSSTGPKVPGTTNRGRKKTISLDPSPAVAAVLAATAAAAAGGGAASSTAFPAGLTIERKKTASGGSGGSSGGGFGGRKSSLSGDGVDRVEITKIPASGSSVSAQPKDTFVMPRSTDDSVSITTMSSLVAATGGASGGDGPLNLSLKPTAASASASAITDYLARLQGGASVSQIPSEYYASQALSGVFLAEQIRQQQLAAALESRLSYSNDVSSSSSSASAAAMNQAMQAALLMNKLKDAGAGATASETSRLLAIAAAAAQQASAPAPSGSSRRKSKKTTVASMLRERSKLTPEELERAEQSVHPELTIEPIFRSMQPAGTDDDNRLKIQNISETPEIRNLAAGASASLISADADYDEDGSMDNGKVSRYATIETPELRVPLNQGWRRETLVREYSKSGVRGDVSYFAPCGKKFKQYPDIIRYLEKNGMNDLTREYFSFSTKVFIGDFLKPTGVMMDNGEEKYITLNEKEMLEDVNKIRAENGWKPRKASTDRPLAAQASSSSSSGSSKKREKQQNVLDTTSITPAMTPEQKMLARLTAEVTLQQQQLQRQEEARLQKEAFRILKEAERLEKLEQARREREAKQRELIMAKRMRQEELARQRHEETARRMQEKELKRQQASALKEQERERRRQHMILMKQLEGKRRNDDRERRRKDFQVEKERERDRRLVSKNLEIEIIQEMRKPVEDMSLPEEDLKPLPEGLKRMDGLLLAGEAFANVLMVFEFLHNFGERLGFDMDSLPTLSDLQAALLNDEEAEEELLSVVTHLLVCAIEDPGIPSPYKHLTILGQNLRQADITNTNVSEILRIYLMARGQYEVWVLHSVKPPETHDPKNRHKEIAFCQKKMDEYNRLHKKTKGYELANWIKDKNFLCLNPTEKAEILGFLCNELLYNKAVMFQIEQFMEKCSKTKKVSQIVESRLKKLKTIHHKKFRVHQAMLPPTTQDDTNASNSNAAAEGVDNKDADQKEGDEKADDPSDDEDSQSVASESTSEATPKKRGGRKAKGKRGRKATKGKKGGKAKQPPPPPPPPPEESDEEEEDDDEEADLEDLEEDDGEDDEKLSQDELTKKIERTVKQLAKVREENVFVNNCLRSNDLGQDRYRRRYWHMAHVGGVMVEAMESCEAWKMAGEGMPHEAGKKRERPESDDEEDEDENGDEAVVEEVDEEISFRKKPKLEDLKKNGVDSNDEDDGSNKENGGDVDMEVKEEQEDKKESEEAKRKRLETEEALRKLGSEILVTPKAETKAEDEEVKALTPRITPNGDKLNLFNHSACFNMSLSPMILNGSVTITPKAELNAAAVGMTPPPPPPAGIRGVGPNAASTPVAAAASQFEARPWFSVLPVGAPTDFLPKFDEFKREAMMMTPLTETDDKTKALLQSMEPVDPTIALLELKLEGIRKTNVAKERRKVPKGFQRGWWRTTDPAVVVELEKSVHVRGAREQLLQSNVRRGMDFCHEDALGESNKKPLAEDVEFEDLDDLTAHIELLEGDAPPPDKPKKWNREVALRVDKYILEQVEALEDKVAAASMQVPTWHPPNRPDIETRNFRPSCETRRGSKDERTDPVAEARERILDLEFNIERRYLKAPLGVSNNEVSLKTITSSALDNSTKSSTPSRRTTNTSLNVDKSRTPLHENGEESGGQENGKHDGDEKDDDDDDENGDGQDSPSKREQELPRGLVNWRQGVRKAKTAAQLAMGFYVLETSIAWHKSIMKAFCQLCHSGEDEDSLLLCDGCDKGYHMYCFKPSITQLPDGDWYCYECINKATGVKHCLVCGKLEGKNLIPCATCPRAYHTDCLSPSLSKVPRGKWQCPGCNQKSKKKIPKRLKIKFAPNSDDDNTKDSSHSSANGVEKEEEEASPPPEKKARRDGAAEKAQKKQLSKAAMEKDLSPCHAVIEEMVTSDDSWPFLYPVNTKQFPTYKKIIKNPMDIMTIKKRLGDKTYKTRDDFRSDVRLIFSNCEIFNEDDSPVGKAGYAMKSLFNTRWAELIADDSATI